MITIYYRIWRWVVLKHKISVIMPVYNSEKYLVQSIDSILNQTYEDFEFIIIDDGSTDNSLSIINSYKDNRIKVITNKNNIGISQSLNIGILNSSGDYIVRMDSDDISLLNRFEKQLGFMESNSGVSICGCNMYIIKDSKKVSETKYCLDSSEIKTDMLFGRTPFAHPTIMMRSSFVHSCSLKYNNSAIYAEDLELYCNYCHQAKYANINKCLHIYRIHNDSVSVKYKETQKSNAKLIIKRFLKSEGLILTEREFEIHCALYLPSENNCSFNEADILKWFNKIMCFADRTDGYSKDRISYLANLLIRKVRNRE